MKDRLSSLESASSTDQGGWKRCAEAWERRAHDGKLAQPVRGVVNGTNWFAVCAASVMSVPPWPSAAVTKLVAM